MTTTISTHSGAISGYLAVPTPTVSGDGPYPGVVLVHDIFGLNDDIRGIADRFATAGYLTLVPDLYSRGGFARCVRSVFRDAMNGTGRAVADVDSARDLLADRPDCTGKIGIAGFCLGGGFALLGVSRGFDASAPYYGRLPGDESVLDGACPVVASFGRRDLSLPGAAAKLDRLLAEREVTRDVKEYPEAGHSFANRFNLGPATPLLKVAGIGYHHESAEDAWRRVLEFFGDHLN